MFINYRLWTLENLNFDKESTNIVNNIINEYNLSTDFVNKLKESKNIKIDTNTFVSINNIFTWPDLSLNLNIDGKCYGLIDQLGILSDGTVVPCCLDSNGLINLGNIFKDDLDEILNTSFAKDIIKGFKENKSNCKLCRNCNFRNRFINK
jgi:radical SAM protein with 4Fe4S-binding SPASM domain